MTLSNLKKRKEKKRKEKATQPPQKFRFQGNSSDDVIPS